MNMSAPEQKTSEKAGSSKMVEDLDICYLHVLSEVQSRFATTEIGSRIINRAKISKETAFVVKLPDAAFLTYFEMEVEGKLIVGQVKDKEEAKQSLVTTTSQDKAETQIQQKALVMEMNKFEIPVLLKPSEEARFKLIYQELLQRVEGVYKHQININPGQYVPDLQVDVSLSEKLPFRLIHVPKFALEQHGKSNQEKPGFYEVTENVKIERFRGKDVSRALIQWRPSVKGKKELVILDGQLIVLYDLKREDDTGEIQVSDGFFIHHFAPKSPTVGNKNILFALDTSSLSEGKLDQCRDAMHHILPQLAAEDFFNMIHLNSSCNVWKRRFVPATKANADEAKKWISALTDTSKRSAGAGGSMSETQSLDLVLVLLTGGPQERLKSVVPVVLGLMKEKGRILKTYALSFGEDGDPHLLKELSFKTEGFARRIYPDLDADVQLETFYEEISSVIPCGVNVKYLNPNVVSESVVQCGDGISSYEGNETVCVGRLNKDIQSLEVEIQGESTATGDLCKRTQTLKSWEPLSKPRITHSVGGTVERCWAYLTIKDLLAKAETEQNSQTARNMKQKASELSLKYGFVTSLTPMVAVERDKEDRKLVKENAQNVVSYVIFGPPLPQKSSVESLDPHEDEEVDLEETQHRSSVSQEEDLYQELSIGQRLPSYVIEQAASEELVKSVESQGSDVKFWLTRSVDKVNDEFKRQGFNGKETLLDLLKKTNGDFGGKRPLSLCCSTRKQKGAATVMKGVNRLIKEQQDSGPMSSNSQILKVVKKLKNGVWPSEYEWIVFCVVVGEFSERHIDDIHQFCKASQFEETGGTFRIKQNLDQSLFQSDLLLIRGEAENRLDVRSQSLFDALQVVFRLVTIHPSTHLPDGVQRLLKLLCECTEQKTEENNDEILFRSGKKIREVIKIQ